MPQTLSEEKIQEWKEKILKQRESGLSIKRWCNENSVVIHTFNYWQTKLFPKILLTRSAFKEIPDRKRICVSDLKEKVIVVEYHGIRIHLDQQFEPSTLKQCLEVLLEVLKDVIC